MNFWTYFDRGAISASLAQIRETAAIAGADGVLSDAKGGAIVSAFMVGFFLTCPVFAALGGTFSAKKIITVGLLVWALACLSTGLATDYWWLVMSRCFVGVGEAAYAGYTVTIIDNIAPPAKRTMWIGLYYSMIPVGTAVGMAAGGIISKMDIDGIDGWRLVFIGELVPMLPIILYNASLPDKYNPVKDTQNDSKKRVKSMNTEELQTLTSSSQVLLEDGADDPKSNDPKEPGEGDEFVTLPQAGKQLACNLDYILLVFGYAMYTFVLGAVAVWAISMLEEGPLNLSNVEASLFMGGVLCVTGLLGSIMGGLFVDKMGGSQGYKGIKQSAKCSVAMLVIGIPCGIIALMSANFAVFAVFFTIGVFVMFSVTAPVNAMLLSSVPPALRTYSISFSIFFMHMLGDFPSPIFTGVVADAFSGGCDAMSGTSNTTACTSVSAECRFIPAPNPADNPSCVNVYQLRNGLLVVWTFLGLAVPAWAVVGCRAARRVAQSDAEHAINERQYTDEGGENLGSGLVSKDPSAEHAVKADSSLSLAADHNVQ